MITFPVYRTRGKSCWSTTERSPIPGVVHILMDSVSSSSFYGKQLIRGLWTMTQTWSHSPNFDKDVKLRHKRATPWTECKDKLKYCRSKSLLSLCLFTWCTAIITIKHDLISVSGTKCLVCCCIGNLNHTYMIVYAVFRTHCSLVYMHVRHVVVETH